MDACWPLPQNKLINRYEPVLSHCLTGQNCTFIGIPHSAKSGYLRFMIQEKNLLCKIVGSTKLIFLDSLSTQSPIEIFAKELNTKSNTKSIIEHLAKYEKVIIVLYRAKYWIYLSEEWVEDLRTIYDKIRENIKTVSYLFLADETNPFQKFNTPFTQFFRGQLQEYTDYFPIMDKDEWEYTIERFSTMNSKIIPDYKEELWSLTHGIYPLTKTAVLEFSTTYKDPVSLYRAPQIQNSLKCLTDLFHNKSTKMTYDDFIGLKLIDNNNEFKSLWIKKALNEKIPTEITKTEKRILALLKKQNGEIVSRDMIAKCIWGNKHIEKYSEWAIEKNISRIRKKLKIQYPQITIVTYKKEGYGIEYDD